MDSFFPFLAAITDHYAKCIKRAEVTGAHSEYTALIGIVTNREKFNELNAEEPTSITDEVAELERLIIKIFKIIVEMDYLR